MDGRVAEQTETVVYGLRQTGWRRRLRHVRTAVLVAAAATVVSGLAYWLHDRFTHVYIDDARITADVISVSSRVSGWVSSLHVAEGDHVTAGHLLVSIDDRDAKLRLAELDARLKSVEAERARLAAQREMTDRQTRSQYDVRRSQLDAARAQLASRASELDLTRADNERVKTLLARNVVSHQRWEQTRNEFLKAQQAYHQAKAEKAAANAALVEAQAARQQLLVIDKQLAILAHQKEETAAQRAQQELDLHDRAIRSPINAVIDKTFIIRSEYVSAGQRLLMLHDPSKVWVAANVKETDIRHVRLGAPVTVTVDAYPGESFAGKVVRIGDAATSEFALLPAPNPSGNFTKIAQRLPIRIELKHKSERLRPGMMVEVRIGIDDR